MENLSEKDGASLFSVKLIVLGLMGAVRILCGMLPLAIVKTIKGRWSKTADRRLKKCISVLVFFGGGVMLATCMLHMLPEVQESFKEALPEVHLPIAQIIFVMGFFLVYMMEDIVHALIHKRKMKKQERKKRKQNGSVPVIPPSSLTIPYKNNSSTNNNDSPADPTAISFIGKSEVFNLNGGLCYANNYPEHHYRKQHLTSGDVTREPRELFKKNIVRKCDDIPGLPGKDRIISTTNIQTKLNHENHPIPASTTTASTTGGSVAGNGRSGLIVGVEKFSYIDPDWFRDTVIANSQANLLGNSTTNIVDNNESKSLHDLQLSKSQNVINDDSSSSSGSTSCSRKKLAGSIASDTKDVESSQARLCHNHDHRHQHDNDEDEDDDHFHHEHSHIPVAFIDGENELNQTIGAEIRNLLIIIAISFHGIFEGLGIGVQNTAEDVWYMFFAVSLHESTILFCIGIELISNKTKVLRMVMYVLIVSLVSPLGIGIGIIITEREFGAGGVQAIVVASLQGLAAGSLLYVTFFEIFQEEGRKLERKYIHIIVAILGFVMMGALEFLGGHKHGGSRSHSHMHDHSHGNKTWDDHDDHDHSPLGHHNETDEDLSHHHHHHGDHDHHGH